MSLGRRLKADSKIPITSCSESTLIRLGLSTKVSGRVVLGMGRALCNGQTMLSMLVSGSSIMRAGSEHSTMPMETSMKAVG